MTVKDILDLSMDNIAVCDANNISCNTIINRNVYENGMLSEKLVNSEVVSITALDTYTLKIKINWPREE